MGIWYLQDMKIFKINSHVEVVCEWKKTRTAFKHEATLLIDGIERDKAKICYVNRTWEKFEFESVIKKLMEKVKILNDKEKKVFLSRLADNDSRENTRMFGTVAMVATLRDIFGKNQREKNDWKARMIKAGLENKGLIMPSDWDALSENTKEVRLNAVIKQLSSHE